jgi:hypothetical protein
MTKPSMESAMLRSLYAAALMLTLSACPDPLPHTDPSTVVTAVFDPTSAQIPLPNDLAVPPFNDPNSVCPADAVAPAGTTRKCAQSELLSSFALGFPNDQEVAITIDFSQTNFDADGKPSQVAPALDLSSFTPSTFFVANTSATTAGEVLLDPIAPTDYKTFSDHGTLTLHHQNHLPWAPGSYTVVVRGGPDGVKTTDKVGVTPSQTFYLVEQGLDMTDPKNLGLLKAQAGSTDKAIALGQQLNLLIGLYKAAVFPVADTRFPHQQLAIAATFTVAPAVTNVSVDPARGLAPLPIDLLRDPRAPSATDPTAGKLTALAACTLAGSSLAADGNCATATATATAAGFKALDGFSTTGAILAPTSDLVQISTVTSSSLQLYDLTDPAHPALVPPQTLILEPCEFASACSPTAVSPVIAIQPAGATAGDPSSVFRTKPLKDNTDYAVVATTDIHDKAGKPIGPGTVARVLQFKNPVIVGGKSALIGIDDATATSLEKMRLQLAPVLAVVADPTKVAMAYTFHTQTILDQANGLAALPYQRDAASAQPGAIGAETSPAAIVEKFGGTGIVQTDNIDEILETDIKTFNALDPATGAFIANPLTAPEETIHVLIATPLPANVTNLCGPNNTPPKCAPLMVFRHGLGRGRADMLLIANNFAAAGMVTVAIDAAKHGDRSFCTSGPASATSGCNGGAACTTQLPPGAQGDAQPPGTCGAAGFVKKGLNKAFVTDANHDGIPLASANYLITANFFRTRDTLRQDLIDESQLIRAIAFDPTSTGTNTVFTHMTTRNGLFIDPKTIYFSGQSLGSIQGTMDVATNPRISKAAFNVGGGTTVDIFTNAPAFAAGTNALLAGLGIDKASNPAGFLQFLVVAKTILDPADPINFAGHLTDPTKTLPDLLHGGTTLQAPKKILTQVAYCDDTVPNPFNLVHSSNIGVGPLPTGGTFFDGSGGGKGTFQLFVGAGFDPSKFKDPCTATTTGTVPHGFLLIAPTGSLGEKAQNAIASFVTTDQPQTRFQP